MPRFTKGDGDEQVVIETSNAREGATLRASGFVESKARTAAVRAADAGSDDVAAEDTEPAAEPADQPDQPDEPTATEQQSPRAAKPRARK